MYETKKIARMMDELSTFFIGRGATQIELSYKAEATKIIITVSAKGIASIEQAVTELRHFLSYPRELEIEEYYWELAGGTTKADELALVGAMTDEAGVTYDDEQICVELIRNKTIK
jgi:hypothetical protein